MRNRINFRVSAALIIHDDKVLATEHDYGEWKDTGNSRAAGRKKGRSERREIKEELGADISIDFHLCTITHQYSTFLLVMDCYLSHVVRGEIVPKEHMAIR